MAFLEDILSVTGNGRIPMQIDVQRTAGPTCSVVSLDETKDYLRIDETAHDTMLTQLIEDATTILEDTYGVAFIASSYRQVQNLAPRMIRLLRFPVLSVTSVKYIADDNADTEVTYASTGYMVSGQFLRCRSVWPTHRQWQSFITYFKAGYADPGASPNAGAITTARAAVPDFVKRAVMQLTGHMYENPEGGGPEVKYETQMKSYGDLPLMVQRLMQPLYRKNGVL
jgi:uncharacterized phiE125 gp8 family phage protein